MADLVFVPLGDGNTLCANNINAVIPLKTAQSRRILQRAKKEDTFLDWTGARKLKTLLLLNDGTVVGSFFSATTVFKRLSKATGHSVDDVEEDEDD